MDRLTSRFYEFGPFCIDAVERLMTCDGVPVHMTPKTFETLLTLVENHGYVVEKDKLMCRLWPDTCVEEANLTQNVFALRKLLGGKSDGRNYIETVARRGYRFIAGVKERQQEARAPQGDVPARGGYQTGTVGKSIAVLPFLNVGEALDLDYLSDGVTENIISNLSRLPQLLVMARSTVFRYKGCELNARQAGRELNVQTVLMGRLREFGGRLLLSVELVNAEDGAQIWGESYNRLLSDIFRVQEEIAREISEKLKVELTGEERKRLTKRPTESSEAYDLYLKGRYFWNKWTLSDVERSLRYFEESLGHDPDCALAHAGIADCFIRLGYLNEVPFSDSIPAIRREAAQAVALDETLADAHSSLGYAELLDLRWAEAEREFCRAIEINPSSAQARSRYAFLLVVRGRREEAVAEMRRALQLDPLSPRMRLNAASVYYYARRYEHSIGECRLVLELEPGFGFAHGILALAYERLGMCAQAIVEVRKGLELLKNDPELLAILGCLHAIMGQRREAKRVLNEMMRLSGQKYVAPFFIACLHAGLRETEQTFEWLERAYDDRSYMTTLNGLPFFAHLRPDPHFADLLRRCGFPPGTYDQ